MTLILLKVAKRIGLCAYLLGAWANNGLPANEPDIVSIKAIFSDREILINDGLIYKVVISNVSRSQITISGPIVEPPMSCIIESRTSGKDWRGIRSYPKGMKSVTPGLIQIPAGGSWAEYGQVFLTTGQNHVFHKPGEYVLRARVSCVIGGYVSDPVTVKVSESPKDEDRFDKQLVSVGHLFLDEQRIPRQRYFDELTEICKRHESGSVVKTLNLFLAIETFEDRMEVAGKHATRLEAFNQLSAALDEVRKDQLAFVLANEAIRRKQWKEVASLLDEIKHESWSRRSIRAELQGAFRRGDVR